MRICIGILGEPSGWRLLLEQEGVPHERAHGHVTPERYSAVVVNDASDDREIEMVRQYLRLGGGVLCSAKVYAEIRGTTSGRRPVSYVLPDDASIFRGSGLADLRQRATVAWNANELPSESGEATAFVGSFDEGNIIALPVDPSKAALDERALRKSFYSNGPRLPFERVAAVDKAPLRRIVSTSLRHLHHARGAWYAHTWYYPEDASSVFALRIDTDRGSAGEVEGLFEFLRERRVRATWFVDVGTQQDFLWRYAQMQGQEIGIHCFEHRVFPDAKRNHANILKARDAFRTLRVGAVGFAAPYGRWSSVLGTVIADFRFLYSSEFSFDFDNLPSRPVLGTDRRGALQVPVHPISIGSLRRQGYDHTAIRSYYERVVAEKRARREPLLFYHHPKDGQPEVLDALVRAASGPGVVHLTMQEYAEWWIDRESHPVEMTLQDDRLLVATPDGSPRAWLHVVRPDGQETFHRVEPRIELASLPWKPGPPPVTDPTDLARARAFNYRIPLTLAVDRLASFGRRR
ncbi:MAG: hypothetical protein MUE68_05670 [Bacteroidetes bacterium]|jgi:hypothetical protein|nr:hypothetical protein [Bacteroidota bacterium]